MKKLHDSLDATERACAIARTWIAKHLDNVPPELVDYVALSEPPELQLNTLLHQGQRDAALCCIGERFGRDGWTRKRTLYGYSDSYSWSKTVDGVVVIIRDAEPLMEENSPVPPTKFPLALPAPVVANGEEVLF